MVEVRSIGRQVPWQQATVERVPLGGIALAFGVGFTVLCVGLFQPISSSGIPLDAAGRIAPYD